MNIKRSGSYHLPGGLYIFECLQFNYKVVDLFSNLWVLYLWRQLGVKKIIRQWLIKYILFFFSVVFGNITHKPFCTMLLIAKVIFLNFEW